MLEDGRLLRLPSVGPGVSFQKALWEQSVHKEPLLLNPNRPGVSHLLNNKSSQVEWIERLSFADEPLTKTDCVPDEIGGILATNGVKEKLRQRFGEAMATDDEYAFWSPAELISDRCNSEAQSD